MIEKDMGENIKKKLKEIVENKKKRKGNLLERTSICFRFCYSLRTNNLRFLLS